MKRRINILPMLLAGIMLFVINITTAGAQAPPSQPANFYGTIKVNGANVADGTQVTAWINGTQQASAATQTYQGDSVYSIAVPNGTDGDTITFQVDGTDANQTGTWALGASTVLNLTVADRSAPTPTAAAPTATPVAPTATPTAPSGLTAKFSCTDTKGKLVDKAPLTINCTDQSTGNITGWSWDFGDGTISTEQNPTHTYTISGTYSVALTVTGSDGSNTATRTNYVYVCRPDENVCAPVISGGNLSVEWTGVIFPPSSIAGFDVLANAISQTWTVTDTTNFGAGWHVTLIADDHLRGEQDRANRVINVGTTHDFKVSCLDSDVEPVADAPTAGNLPTCSVGAQPIPNSALAETPLTILSAAQNDGIGPYTFVPQFQLIIPGTTRIDVYGTNIFVDVISGP